MAAWPDAGGLGTAINDLRALAVGAGSARRVVYSPRAMKIKGLAMTLHDLSWMGVFLDDEDEGLARSAFMAAGLKTKGLPRVRGTFSRPGRRGPYPPRVRHLR